MEGATGFGVRRGRLENRGMKEEAREDMKEVAKRIEEWQVENPKATLSEMERAVDAEMNKVRSQIMKRLVEERERQEEKEQLCPNCGRKMGKNGRRNRQLKTKGNETIEFERQQFRCSGCGMTRFPPR